ncbi:MAG: TonB-dependent receptor [Lautropia sp.]|nr:TonB-dependent receptor [Lautropia sp.]
MPAAVGFRPLKTALTVSVALTSPLTLAQSSELGEEATPLGTITVSASADASATGLSKRVAGGLTARGGRVGIFGTQDQMDVPFAVTSYTNELIQDQQSQSVGSVLQNDPSVRTARGFGNFQESFFVRGFILYSDDIAYNGLYGVLPRQYIPTELFERVEVLRGASTFLTGATPGGSGAGGTVNLLPKRAPNEPLNRVDIGLHTSRQFHLGTDLARRFGPNGETGLRLNASYRKGGSGIDHEDMMLGLASAALDWRNDRLRLSADLAFQDHQLKQTRTNVSLADNLTSVPSAPDGKTNWAQPWSFSEENGLFGTVRGEYDLNEQVTGWFALGGRSSDEENSLANLTVNAANGDGSTYRFDNGRKEQVISTEFGLRANFDTAGVKHEAVVSASTFNRKNEGGYTFDFSNTLDTNLYRPVRYDNVSFTDRASSGNSVSEPALREKTMLTSLAIGDTMHFLDDRMLLTLGARYQTLKVDTHAWNTGVLEERYDKRRTSPMFGLVYKLPQKVSLYANYIEGLAKGETAPATRQERPVANPGAQLAPYVSKQKEIGVKYDAGNTLIGLALFTTDQPRAFVNDANIFTASGKNRHRGAELMIQGQPIRGLTVLGGLTLLDAKQITTGDATTDGKRVIGVPKHQGSLTVDWQLPWVSGLSTNARLVTTGGTKANATNTLTAPGWSRLDIGASYLMDVGGNLVTVRARIDNLTNRRYWSSVGGHPGSGYLVQGAPRTFSLGASVDF